MPAEAEKTDEVGATELPKLRQVAHERRRIPGAAEGEHNALPIGGSGWGRHSPTPSSCRPSPPSWSRFDRVAVHSKCSPAPCAADTLI